MSKTIQTNFMHRLGPIVISTGIGDTLWGAFIQKSAGSLKRFKPISMERTPGEVAQLLRNYKGKTIWRKSDAV